MGRLGQVKAGHRSVGGAGGPRRTGQWVGRLGTPQRRLYSMALRASAGTTPALPLLESLPKGAGSAENGGGV